MSTERELIQRLADALAGWQLGGAPPEDTADADLITEARTALAQPEPEGPTDKEIIAGVRAVLAHLSRPAIKPVPVSERMPQPGKKVLAHYINALGKPRTIIAEWVPAKTREDSPEGDIGEYDEDTDRFYWPQGWYEQIESWDELDALLFDEGEITHWQPLLCSPHHALPVPQQ